MMSMREEEIIMNSLRNLACHETMTINDETYVMKVPGGLLYRSSRIYYTDGRKVNGAESSVFVPFE